MALVFEPGLLHAVLFRPQHNTLPYMQSAALRTQASAMDLVTKCSGSARDSTLRLTGLMPNNFSQRPPPRGMCCLWSAGDQVDWL